ncbi:MAG: DedA family protein [Pseudomonas sp.]|uniref:DedA family protein n=1 Tax=unclassified Pseudomonas TaxID=196821 RepID=UPI001CFA5E92|nr:DedA family protein [Pseudomonas sp. L5B5]UCZ83612.1 DedA family protein [Pseudomonas sp. L5B5]
MLEHLDLNALIATYGYWVIFIGCLLEGETVLILGGMAAHQGNLQWPQVIGLAALGGILGDQLLFWTGRYSGARILPKLKRHQAAIERANGLIKRYPLTSVFAVRFLYGMRLVGPMVIGASGLAAWRFALLNVIGAAVWAVLFVSAGYWAGEALQHFLGDLKPYRLPIFLGVVALLALAALVRHLRNRRKAHRS